MGLTVPGETGNLRSRALLAAGWSLAAYAGGYVLRLFASLIMTRILVPEMFGVMAVATIVQVVASMLCDVGLRQAVIQNKRGDDPLFLDTAWTLQIIRGVVIWVVCAACAAMIALGSSLGWFAPGSVYSATNLPPILVVIALQAIILGFQSTNSMSSDRHLDQRQLGVVELTANAAGLCVAILIGLLTRSIWSFVVSNLFAAVLTVVLTHWYLPGHRNRLRLDRADALELMRFGRWVLVSSLFTVLAANGDRILLAGWTDPAMLGMYVLAYNLVAMIEGGGGRLFWSVAMPAFSRIALDRPDEVRDAYYRVRLPCDAVFVGCAGLLFGCGEAVVQLLYDDRYAEASRILQILSFSLLFGRYGLANALFLAIGEPKNLGIINGIKTAALFISVVVAHAFFGFEGALWAIALHGSIVQPVIFVLNGRLGLNNLAFEAAVLLFWPMGFLVGLAAAHAIQPLRALV